MANLTVKGFEVLSVYKTEGYGKQHFVMIDESVIIKTGDEVKVQWGGNAPDKVYRVGSEVGSFYCKSLWEILSDKDYRTHYEVKAELVKQVAAPAPVAPPANAPIPFNPGQPVVHQNGVNPQGMEQMFNMFQQFMAMNGMMQMQNPAPQMMQPVMPTLPVQPQTVIARGKGTPIVVTDTHRKQAKQQLGLNRPGVVSQQDKLRIEALAQTLAGARF